MRACRHPPRGRAARTTCPRLPRHARPRSSTLRASSRRSGVGSEHREPESSPLVAGVPSSPARSASIESPTSASTPTPSRFDPIPCGIANPGPARGHRRPIRAWPTMMPGVLRTGDPAPPDARVRFDHDVCVDPAEAEGADAGATRQLGPRFGLVEQCAKARLLRVPRGAPRNAGSAASRRDGSRARS